MKISAIAILFLSFLAHAQESDCKLMKIKKLEMEVIALNIENVNTTKTSEGGPYKRKKVICKSTMCAEISFSDTITKHIPNHPDADKMGNVKFPAINLQQELQTMIETRSEFEQASRNCKG